MDESPCYCIVLGHNNTVAGTHSIAIGTGLVLHEPYQLKIKVGDILVDTIMTEREHTLVYNAIMSVLNIQGKTTAPAKVQPLPGDLILPPTYSVPTDILAMPDPSYSEPEAAPAASDRSD